MWSFVFSASTTNSKSLLQRSEREISHVTFLSQDSLFDTLPIKHYLAFISNTSLYQSVLMLEHSKCAKMSAAFFLHLYFCSQAVPGAWQDTHSLVFVADGASCILSHHSIAKYTRKIFCNPAMQCNLIFSGL